MQCRFCHSTRLNLWTSTPRNYYQCVDCLFISVAPLPTSTELDQHYFAYHDLNHQADEKKNLLRSYSYKQEIAWMMKYIPFLSKSIDREVEILDYGCSGGYLLDMLSETCQEIPLRLYGTDISIPAIDILKQKGYYYEFDKIRSQTLFDLAILRGVIEHVPDFKSLIDQILGSVKVGGYFFITATPNGTSTCSILYRHNWVQHHYPSHIQHFSAHHFDYLCAEHGFSRVDSVDLYFDSPYKKPDDSTIFINSVKDNGLSFHKVPEAPLNKKLGHAYFGSMLTLLYKKTAPMDYA